MNPWDASRAEAKVPGLATASQSSCGESNTQKKLGKSALCVCVCVCLRCTAKLKPNITPGSVREVV